MLSMNKSTSVPVESRKYSAMVRADRATRRRAPGGSFIWPKTMQVCDEHVAAGVADLGVLHFQPQVVALAGPLADAGEDGKAAVGAGDPGDQLGEDDGLAQAGPAEQPRLAAADERRQQVDHLDAGLEDFRLRREVGHRRGLAVDGPIVLGLDGPAAVDRLAHQIEDAAQGGLADGHLDRRAGVEAVHAADHAVGVAQGDAADAAAAEVLLHFAGQVHLDALSAGRRPSRRCRSPACVLSGNSASKVEPMTWVTRPMLRILWLLPEAF